VVNRGHIIFLKIRISKDPLIKRWRQLQVWIQKLIPMEQMVNRLDSLLKDPHLKTGLKYTSSHELVYLKSSKPYSIRLYALGFLRTYIDWH